MFTLLGLCGTQQVNEIFDQEAAMYCIKWSKLTCIYYQSLIMSDSTLGVQFCHLWYVKVIEGM